MTADPRLPRLWEPEHSYHCEEHDYNTGEGPTRHGTWGAFARAMGDCDPDYNLLFRWDWARPDAEAERDHDELRLFFFHQRKGRWCAHFVRVSEADEPAVRAWLAERWAHLQRLWAPVAGDVVAAEREACAQLCDLAAEDYGGSDSGADLAAYEQAVALAVAIRARGVL